jgi:putative ABC transport system ATP-binding protein
MFRLEDVIKNYRRRVAEVVALQTAALEIAKGQYVAIVGPSGSGKTTLLSMLGGMLAPDRGRVWLEQTSLYEISATARARLRGDAIGFVFQTFNLLGYLTAVENVEVPLYLAGFSAAEQRARAAALLERVGLGDRLDHKPAELSIGERQRAAMARTLANRPPVILADEPTGNLDAESRRRVLDFFAEFHGQGHTIVVATHDPFVAEQAQRKLTLRAGAIVADELQPQAKAA